MDTFDEYHAHTPNRSGVRHPLVAHLLAVAERAGANGSKFGGEALCYTLGITHDAGKANPRFQRYLDDCARGGNGRSVPHAAPGAAAVREALGPFVLAALGHHAGLHDMTDAGTKLAEADPDAVSAAREFLHRLSMDSGARPAVPAWITEPLPAEMFIRFCFSALVDADYLDTEKHFDADKSGNRANYQALTAYASTLDTHLDWLVSNAPPTTVNAVRAEVLRACRDAAVHDPGAFRLSVPTGGGKTLSGLSFALRHATASGRQMDRVIVAIPYTSIIDQTAQIYGSVFGNDAILEHHSAVTEDEETERQTEHEYRRRLAAENWDCPLIVTTTVQLFESLFAAKPSRCRKLYNIARSVIVLDEVQTLPPACLGPILDVLNELVAHYGCSVVLCTATQPDYSTVDDRLVRDAHEIAPGYPKHFAQLKRVQYEIDDGEWAVEQVAEKIDAAPQVLTVLNTRKDAIDIARACRRDESLFHLSTLMCGHHRKRVISTVKERLAIGAPVRLVSTQVVEAGVDVDFPLVMRDLGPLDRIIQVAGRCNREGRLSGLGTCVVFRLKDGRTPRGAYRTFTDVTVPLLREYGERIDAPEATGQYFRDAFGHTETGSFEKDGDRADIQKQRERLAYRTVADQFKLIDDNTTAIVVMEYPFADVDDLVSRWQYYGARDFFRRLAPYTVSVFDHDLRRLRADGFVTEHESGALLYAGPYDPLFGITPDLPDPADLIA